ERVEELDDLLRQRCSARDADPEAAAEPVLDLRVDEPVGEPVLESEAEGEGLPGLPELACATADAKRPLDQRALRARRLGELRRDAGVDLLEHPWHAREDGRAHRRERVRDRV